MTRKDYIALAQAFKNAKPFSASSTGEPERYSQWLRCIDEVTTVLCADNGRFDLDRFESACGVEGK